MRVLVTWGSKLGGTAGIAQQIAESMRHAGLEVVTLPANVVRSLAGVDAVIVGGALYANRWHPAARRFVTRHARALRGLPVWMFSSGPLDASADGGALPPPPRVRALAELIGAQEHVTFGGRLAADARGFPARAMARTMSGDWRNGERIRRWADEVAVALPAARPRPAIDPPGHGLPRVVAHAALGWLACATVMFGLLALASARAATIARAIAAPLLFAPIAVHYFRPRGARAALPVAVAFAAIAAALEVVMVAGLVQRSPAMLRSLAGTWLPLALVALVTWGIGALMSTMPWPRRGVPSAPAPCVDGLPSSPSSSPAR